MKRKSLVIECWDNGGETFDRYTIAISGNQEINGIPYTYFLGASEHPFHPQGFGQHGMSYKTREYNLLLGGWRHLGKRITFNDLPPDVRRFVAQELMPE